MGRYYDRRKMQGIVEYFKAQKVANADMVWMSKNAATAERTIDFAFKHDSNLFYLLEIDHKNEENIDQYIEVNEKSDILEILYRHFNYDEEKYERNHNEIQTFVKMMTETRNEHYAKCKEFRD